MDNRWLSHLSGDESAKKEFKQLIINSKRALDRLSEILTRELETSEKEQCSAASYDCPNWAYKQADYIATQRNLKRVIDLLKIY